MTILFTFFTSTIAAVMSEGLRRSLQATPRPSGAYVSNDPEASGQLTFNAGTFDMNIMVLGCHIAVQGLQYTPVFVEEVDYDIQVTYGGTDLAQKVAACNNPRIVIDDFDTLYFFYDPSTDTNAIEMHSTTEEWDGRFEHD
ncbi:hypothetical protein FOL47_002895 [Perkinsus chesapeaki]|uniref:Uncharacterized protein n=1 Tax=Perkinsus chesapeaki TaxID=330153 RepID=A0A7J6MC18_PERCH|nr:hypothetical protein FOL47_002895 [Perkinsus chesapeaki]